MVRKSVMETAREIIKRRKELLVILGEERKQFEN
jgi:rRNA maturation protein Rpf1